MLGPSVSSPPGLPRSVSSPRVERHEAAYDSYLDGNPEDVQRPVHGGLALMGGGEDQDEAFRWMIEHSGGGDFVVLRASGEDGYNPYIRDLGGADSVETLVLKSREASYDPYVLSRIEGAEAIFLAGGDQSQYVACWKDTPLQEAINAAAARGVPVGGTSAGLAVMGEFAYSARNDTVTSPEALQDPRHERVTLEKDFLRFPTMRHVVTDTHFGARDRMGRLVTFLADVTQDQWSDRARAVGVDEATAVLVEPDGSSRVAGKGNAYFLTAPGRPQQCLAQYPLRWYDVPAYRLEGQGTGTFDFGAWQGQGGVSYTLTAEDGQLRSSKGDVY